MLGGEEWRRPQLLLQVEPYLPTYTCCQKESKYQGRCLQKRARQREQHLSNDLATRTVCLMLCYF